MTTGAVTANSILSLVFNAAAWSNIAANATGSPATSLYAALHSADPTSSGTQSSNEIAYTGYSRVAVARSSAGWAVSGNSVNPVANITFPTGTGGSGTATYASIGMSSGGAGVILWSGPVSPSIIVGNDITPALTSASTVTIGVAVQPPAAKAAGYNTRTFATTSNFASDSVDVGATYGSGFQWYKSNFFGENPAQSTVTLNGDGSVTLQAANASNINNQISSVGIIAGSPHFVGTAFGGGAYFEAVFTFDATATNNADGWTSWWSMALEHLIASSGGPQEDQWPGQAPGYVHFSENDFFEADFVGAGHPGVSSVWDWYDVFDPSTGFKGELAQVYGLGTSFGGYHKYGSLWIPATLSSQGSITTFFDDVQQGPPVTYSLYNGVSDTPPPTGQPWKFGIIDAQHMALMLGAGTNTPMQVQSVAVWQASAVNNLTN